MRVQTGARLRGCAHTTLPRSDFGDNVGCKYVTVTVKFLSCFVSPHPLCEINLRNSAMPLNLCRAEGCFFHVPFPRGCPRLGRASPSRAPGAVAGRDRLSGQAEKSRALGMPWCQPPALPHLPTPQKGRQSLALPGFPGRQGCPSPGLGTAPASPVPQGGALCRGDARSIGAPHAPAAPLAALATVSLPGSPRTDAQCHLLVPGKSQLPHGACGVWLQLQGPGCWGSPLPGSSLGAFCF